MGNERERYTLGLDMGSASLGWAVVTSKKVIDAGVRVFDPGVDLTIFEKGQPGSSHNVARREARLHRRQLWRRARRQDNLFRALQRAGLLPNGEKRNDVDRGRVRHEVLETLDGQLREKWLPRLRESTTVTAPEQVIPYYLRAVALEERLEPFELGRAFYHLGQRRGFKSNRREPKKISGGEATEKQKKQDERSEIKQHIRQLESNLGERTLGQYFATLDPAEARIRGRWTSRAMYEKEFERIWTKQAEYYSELLTPQRKKEIYDLIFTQRPLKENEEAIGKCALEEGERRAPMATLAAQRFRLLQKVNDLRIVAGLSEERTLSNEERTALLERLETGGDITFAEIRKLPNFRKQKFNLEAGGEKKLPGNRTAKVMLCAFGERWHAMTPEQRGEVVEKWRRTDSPEELMQVGIQQYGLTEEAAQEWAESEPEDGYCSLSLKALHKVLPGMEKGRAFKTVEKEVYGERFSGAEAKSKLPPAEEVLARIPNPAVKRSLTELRKVVNAIIRRYGKPAEIRIELAREIKKNAKERESAWRDMREQQKRRDSARAAIQELGITNPSRDDIEKAMLWEESKVCPYCGQSISFQQLFDENGQAEVEHILPLSRFPDNSFGNKTIAHRSCNQEKGGRTPWEAFGHDDERWAQIIARVKAMGNRTKLEAFQIQSPEALAEFSERRLTDTRYTTKLAAEYLEQLYGGRDIVQPDGSKKRVIYASSGLATATLRKAWGLESILREAAGSANGENKGKPRTDHRHHAVDAIVIGLTSNRAIQQLSAAAAAGDNGRDRISSRTLQAPWPDFVESIRPTIEQMKVSHRPKHKLNGQLHDENSYGVRQNGKGTEVHFREPVQKAATHPERIVDPKVREAVEKKLEEVGGKADKLENNFPVMKTRDGRTVPIKRVRVRVRETKVLRLDRGYVLSASNHHVTIFEIKGKKGRIIWDSPEVVSRHEAMRRKSKRENIVQRTLPDEPDAKFLFSIATGDVVEMDDETRKGRNLFVVRSISEEKKGGINLEFVRHTDARQKDEIKKAGEWYKRSVGRLRELHCRKVHVDLLGRVKGGDA